MKGLVTPVTLGSAVAVDLLWGEPPGAIHPVVWMGRLIGALERRAPEGEAARLSYGVALVGIVVACAALSGWVVERVLERLGLAGAVLLGMCLKPAFAVRELLAATERVAVALDDGDLVRAREHLRWLVSRETSALDAPLLAAAAIESVAENASDSAVAPLVYFGLFGLAGAMGYRAVNTLDAMLGYRNERYEHLGKAAARLDDAANFVPARLTALLLTLAAPLVSGAWRDAGAAWAVTRRDHGRTTSPNAGWPMAAAAGALGVALEKVGHYRLNGGGPAPDGVDVRRAIRLVQYGLLLGAPALLALRRRRERR